MPSRASASESLVERAKAARNMRGNPLPLTDAELTEIAEPAL